MRAYLVIPFLAVAFAAVGVTSAHAQTVSGWSRLPSDDWCTVAAHCAPYSGRDKSIVESRCNLATPRFPASPNGEGLCEFKAIICDDGDPATQDMINPVTKQCGNWAPADGTIRTVSTLSRLPTDDTCNSDYDCQPTVGRDPSITAVKCNTTKHQCQFKQYLCDDGNQATQDVLNPRTKECGMWVPYHQEPPPACTVQCNSAAECDDGDPCTAESCAANGQCHHAAVMGEACCPTDWSWTCLPGFDCYCLPDALVSGGN